MAGRGLDRTLRRGFSLIETLVALTITALAMTLIFEIGGQARDDGLRLGRRAVAATEVQPGLDAFRTLVSGATSASSTSAREMRFSTVTDRTTPCGGPGPINDLRITLASGPDGDVATCDSAARPEAVVLLTFPADQAHFAYSANGTTWKERLSGGEFPLVRLTTQAGRLDMIEAVGDQAGLAEGGS